MSTGRESRQRVQSQRETRRFCRCAEPIWFYSIVGFLLCRLCLGHPRA